MSNTIKLPVCPQCGAPIPAGAPQGLCPKCVLLGAATGTDAGVPATATSEIPSLERVAAAFPQLEILELIGRGGMGFVFKARQPHLDRLVALKLLPDKLARDPRFAERFNREGRVLARLNHPNIVSVYDFGQTGNFYYLLMEYVDGVNLRQAMKAGRFSPAEALAIVPRICEALQYAHGAGILHRDIKPENILLDARGQVKIADFGIAKLVGEDHKADITLTATGAALGTPHYMAPEQLEKPSEVDHRADIYSLGVVFYEMLTGELPIGRFAPPSSKTPVGAEVDEVVFRTLEKDRERRFQSAGEMKSEVEHLTETGAFSAAGVAPGAPPRPIKEATCRITTPEHTRSFVGRFLFTHQGTGTLRLTGETLSFERGWNSVSIPLRDIQALGIGHYSAWAVPVRLDYLVVTFTEHGRARSLFFTPTNPGLTMAWDANQLTAEWHEAVARAAQALTGQRPAAAAPELLGAPLPSPLARTLLFVGTCLVGFVAALAVFWFGKGRLPASVADWWRILPALLPALAAMGWVLWREHRARRIPEPRPTAPTPPALPGGGNVVPKWSHKAIWGAVLTGLSLPVPVLFAVALYLRLGGLGPAEFAILLAMISLPGLAGVLLGWMALSDIRAHAGRLRGLPLAVFAALTWPLLVLVGGTLILPSVTLLEPTDGPPPAWRAVFLLVPVGTLTFALWAVHAAIRWGNNQGPSRQRGILKWVFLGLLAVGIAVLALSNRAPSGGRQVEISGHQGQPIIQGQVMTAPADPPASADGGRIHFTILTVELRDEGGAQWLAMDYVANVEGDCERVFRVEADRFKVITRTTERLVNNTAGAPIRHQRVEWKLPEGYARADALQLRDELAKTLAGRSVEVRAGEEKPLLRAPLNDLGTLSVTLGAMPGGPDAIRIRQAHVALDHVHQRHAAGLVGQDEIARAELNLAVAEARGDAVKVATANLQYAEGALVLARKRFEAGVVPTEEVRQLENQRDLARAELQAAERRANKAKP